ncbi:DUF3108 domain-containing protein [Solilutibacter silvestris]|uniref:DUF3108 domain-containing protein n=1 Tax=Solilutibacter silvestris TaxID=1645665 RepID=UPI0013FE26D7|nr:DUF3108 domain-containing protein [Lysobacter silvestris]
MKPFVASALAGFACVLSPLAIAQATVPAPTSPQVIVAPDAALPPLPRKVLVPFRATYSVARNGSPAGVASMQVVDLGGGRWRLDLGIRGTQGLAGLAGLNLQQSTVFERVGDTFRPLSQATIKNLLLRSQRITGSYDWSRNSAQWTGDVSSKRRAPVALQPGDMNTLLVNLAVVRDADAGKPLQYRVVDNGRARLQAFITSAAKETITVGDLSYDAWHVSRTNAGSDGMDAWVSDNVPTPVRIVQKDGDTGTLELLLTDYKGPAK